MLSRLLVTPSAGQLLDKVGRVRAIGLSSRSTVQTRENPEAQLVISPVPYQLTMQVLRERMENFGKATRLLI